MDIWRNGPGKPAVPFPLHAAAPIGRSVTKYVLGEDEAFRFADKAAGWFLHAGYDTIAGMGITVDDVSAVQDRSTLMVDEEARRYGFDIRIRYVRTDTRKIGTIEHVVTKKGDSNEL